MTVTKRLRFEILRRDNHACRYCGRTAPDVILTVDHVVPVALGGSDDSSNLVTACRDCNAGKSSVPAGAPLVDDVAADALRWAKAMTAAAELSRQKRSNDKLFTYDFIQAMLRIFHSDEARYELPDPDVVDEHVIMRSVIQFRDCGLDLSDLEFAIRKAMANKRLHEEHIWRYFCGVCWRMVEDRQETARALLEVEDND